MFSLLLKDLNFFIIICLERFRLDGLRYFIVALPEPSIYYFAAVAVKILLQLSMLLQLQLSILLKL